jgi:hypothetical protein
MQWIAILGGLLVMMGQHDRSEALFYALFLLQAFVRADHIDCGGIERALDMHRVIFLDHPDARTTVLGNLIDVGALHQPHADIRVCLMM